MKTGFIGFRVDPKVKEKGEVLAELENISLSELMELLLKIRISQAEQKHEIALTSV